MTTKLGLLALLEAKPEKRAELAAFLEGGSRVHSHRLARTCWPEHPTSTALTSSRSSSPFPGKN